MSRELFTIADPNFAILLLALLLLGVVALLAWAGVEPWSFRRRS